MLEIQQVIISAFLSITIGRENTLTAKMMIAKMEPLMVPMVRNINKEVMSLSDDMGKNIWIIEAALAQSSAITMITMIKIDKSP